MTTMLEKAARAVAAALLDGPVDPSFSLADVNGWTEDKAYEIARAVLMAVREPDGAMLDAGGDAIFECFDGYNDDTKKHLMLMARPRSGLQAKLCFTAMIDHILNEPTDV